MPGGEVTPDGLIAVGRIAKSYGLYTKLTGGQRVDLFGARLEQLPLIWEELIAAGFESGHADGAPAGAGPRAGYAGGLDRARHHAAATRDRRCAARAADARQDS